MSSTLVSHSGCLGPHEFTLVSHLSHTLGALGLGPHDFTLVSHLSPTCLPLVSQLVSHTCLPLWVPWEACLPHLSPTLGALGRMSLHLSSTCLPHLSPGSGCLGPHHFTLVSRLSLTLWGALGRMSLHLSSTCLPHLSFTLGVLEPHEFTLVSHLSPHSVSHTCLPLWVPWAA